MDNEATVDQLESMKISDENCVFMVAKDVVELPPPPAVAADGGASLVPITPDFNRESGEFLNHFNSPLTLVSSPSKALCFDSPIEDNRHCLGGDDSPRTPREGVFDPFAPGADKFVLAPLYRKYETKTGNNFARRLNFESFTSFSGDVSCASNEETVPDDEMLVESVYDTLLEAILSRHTEENLTDISPIDPCIDGFKTPPSTPRLNGITETCPCAPIKSVRKSKNIELGLCRKLDFDLGSL